MTQKLFPVGAAVFLGVALGGCSRPLAQNPSVSGKILLDGQPLANVCLQFWLEGASEPSAFATSDEEGNFVVDPGNWSVFRPGTYCIRLLDMEAMRPREPAAPDEPPKLVDAGGAMSLPRFPGEYGGRNTTPLRVDIREHQAVIPPLNIDSGKKEQVPRS